EVRIDEAVNIDEIAEKPARQIDEMNALIEQFAAAGDGRIGTPFAVVTEAAAVPVAGADVQQWSQFAGVMDRPSLEECRMKAMVKAHFDENACLARRLHGRPQFLRI